MAKGKRPDQPQATPWTRWGGVLAGLAVAGAIVWWVARPSDGDRPAAESNAAEAPGPQPLDLGAGGPTVEAASLLDVPPDSLAASGPDAPGGIDVSNDPRLGDPDAPVTIVEFSDFQCPHCARFHEETFPALRTLYGDQIQWVFVNRFFSSAHPMARPAAVAAECAHRQGRFWPYAELVFAEQDRLSRDRLDGHAQSVGLDLAAFRACVEGDEPAAEVDADQAEAERLGVDATPTFYVNGQAVVGAQPIGQWNEILSPYFGR